MRVPKKAWLALVLVFTILPIRFASADGNDFKIDFAAARPGTYNQDTGTGGFYGDGGNANVVESLVPFDFECDNKVVFFAAVEVDKNVTDPQQTIRLDFSFDKDTTGQTGAGYTDVSVVGVNTGDPGLNVDGDEVVTANVDASDPDVIKVTAEITKLESGEVFILRLVATLGCDLGETPTGVIQARLTDAQVTAPKKDDIFPGQGEQTIPLKVKGQGDGAPDRASITIVKNTIPNDEQNFKFTTEGEGLSDFTLDDDGNPTLDNTKVFPDLMSFGDKKVTETSVDGFELTDIECTGDADLKIGSDSDFDAGDASVTIDLDAGENVTCVFENTKKGLEPGKGSITIIKKAKGYRDFRFTLFDFETDEKIKFRLDVDKISLVLDRQIFELDPGLFSVTESAADGFTLTDLDCEPDDGVDIDLPNRKVTIDLDAGDEIICTFTNTNNRDIPVTNNPNDGPPKTTETVNVGSPTDSGGGTPDVVQAPGPQTPVAAPGPPTITELPRTGINARTMAILGLTLILIGGMALGADRWTKVLATPKTEATDTADASGMRAGESHV